MRRSMADQERRIVVEIVSHSDVSRLEARDDAIKEEVAQLRKELNAFRMRLYEVMEAIGDIRRHK